jgi:mRNA-degrading endonuclease RelE of RelBE toxin-antitoxin system
MTCHIMPFFNLHKLKGKESSFRVRVGDYRILYTVDYSRKVVVVFKVDWRVYEH